MFCSLKKKYKIDINNYEIIKKISQGGFGVIYLVLNKQTSERLVAKVNINTNIMNDRQSQFVKREISILMHVQHQTIIPLRGFSLFDFDGNQNVTIFMDYMKNGSLLSLLDKEKDKICPSGYNNTKRQIILAGIARGMMILHGKNIIHRDLTSGNILLDEDFHPRITDFGLSKFFDPEHSKSQTLTDCGTAIYMAPEVILSDTYNTKADVYSFGILMFEIVTKSRAYSDFFSENKKANIFLLKKQVTEGFRPKIKVPIKEGLKKLIERCFSEDPKKRPTFYELFQKLSLLTPEGMNQFEKPSDLLLDDLFDDDDYDADQFCLDDVNFDEFQSYIDSITETSDKKKDFEAELIELKKKHDDEIKEMKETIQSQEERINSLFKIIDKQSLLIQELSNEVKLKKHEIESTPKQDNLSIEPLKKISKICFSAKISSDGPGIFYFLKSQETNKFDRLIVASSSSRDVYNLIYPQKKDNYKTPKDDNSQIEFQLEESILINGIKIYSSVCNYPKTFDIQIDEKTVKSITEATELNGKHQTMIIKFQEERGKIVRFIKKGCGWDKRESIIIGKIEILSPEKRFSEGVFATLINESKEKDPHKCNVFISATNYDPNFFHLCDTSHKVLVSISGHSWFQVELIKGSAIISGFRIKAINFKCFKIIATNDCKESEDNWVTLFDSTNDEDDQKFNISKAIDPSPPVSFIRIVKTNVDVKNNGAFEFKHFEIFGDYLL